MISFSSNALFLWIFALSLAGVSSQYQQECHSLDSVTDTLIGNLKVISVGGPDTPSCTKSADCTALNCTFDLVEKRMEMSIKLSPCTSPPQMTFTLQDASGRINLKKNITHQTTFPLPSFGITIMKSSIRVDFQPVTNGVQFGLYLVTEVMSTTFNFPPVTTPLVPDQVINTPPCDPSPYAPTVTEGQGQAVTLNSEKCTDMDDMLAQATIPSDFACYSNMGCNGFHCKGTVEKNDLNVSLYMDPCSIPVSYNITITSASLNVAWSHNFTHTETVQIVPGPPLKFRLHVTMNPDPSGNSINTTIKIAGCTTFFRKEYCPFHELLLDSQPIPVPPCTLPSSSPSSPAIVIASTPTTPNLISSTQAISNECTSWANIIHDMTTSANVIGTMTCNVTANCTGIVCVDMFSNQKYVARLDLQHCLTPVELWMSIKSEDRNVDWQRTVTHGESFQVPGATNTALFLVNLEKHDDEHVELGVNVLFTAFGFNYSDVLIKDQLIPVEPCNGTNPTVVSMTTGKTNKITGTNPTVVSMTTGKTNKITGKPTMNTYGMTTAMAVNDKPNKVPITDEEGSNNVGIVFGVLMAGMVVLCVIAGLLYVNRHRRYHRPDETALVEDSFAEI